MKNIKINEKLDLTKFELVTGVITPKGYQFLSQV